MLYCLVSVSIYPRRLYSLTFLIRYNFPKKPLYSLWLYPDLTAVCCIVLQERSSARHLAQVCNLISLQLLWHQFNSALSCCWGTLLGGVCVCSISVCVCVCLCMRAYCKATVRMSRKYVRHECVAPSRTVMLHSLTWCSKILTPDSHPYEIFTIHCSLMLKPLASPSGQSEYEHSTLCFCHCFFRNQWNLTMW